VVFPSLKAKKLKRVLMRKPLSYRVVGQEGSHCKLESKNGYPPIDFVHHDKDNVPPGLVRRMLVHRVGLTEPEARKLIK
jgi:predicted RNA binding protein YcfA (HicA-like mRNA interferase family)